MPSNIKTAHELRRAFIDFFVQRGHTEVPSAPLVPKGDPTLLFTSAGMVQFKDYYLRPENLPYTRATSVQKCLRAGDLESVGRTLRHHTFFEMLGNFSFGDYFKVEAITWAWEFVVDVLKLPVDKLYVSVYEDDDEAFKIWNEEIGLSADRIYRLGKDDNFWGPVGKTGVCGPSSEIYFDTGPERGCGRPTCAPGCECDRYLEIWNLVFPQFFLEENGEYRRLEKPGIDTGLGLERVATILQGVEDNFHTDLFRPIIRAVYDLLPRGVGKEGEDRMGVNMIADHARALTFTVSEGIYPSNEGRGYILRRLVRRALTRFYNSGMDKPFLYKLIDVVVDVMKDDYPELDSRSRNTAMIIRSEEEVFFRTLAEGKGKFESIVDEVKKAGNDRIDGKRVFILYDTYGFPLELTKALAAAEGLGVDEEGFAASMEEQRNRAKEKSGFDVGKQELVEMTRLDDAEGSKFVGYEVLEAESSIVSYRIMEGDGAEGNGDDSPQSAAELVFKETPFYATSGGQVADSGVITIGGVEFEVFDVFKRGGEIVHLIRSGMSTDELEELIRSEGKARLNIDREKRLATARNHTATHLLHAALRKVVGEHVAQAGSLVESSRFRFDFNHFQPISREAVRTIERMVNGWILDAIDVETRLMGYKEAVKEGAVALFDEKYGKEVRVVRIDDVSMELCGGTHIDNTGKIGSFIIISEQSVAAGVRRIEAVTGKAAVEYARTVIDRSLEAASLLNGPIDDIVPRIEGLMGEVDSLRKKLKKALSQDSAAAIDRMIASARNVDGVVVASGRIDVGDVSALRNQADLFRNKVRRGVAVFSSEINGKLQFIIAVTDDLVGEGRLTADRLVKDLAALAGGGGGGKRHLAQLGTKDLESEQKVFDALPDLVKRLV